MLRIRSSSTKSLSVYAALILMFFYQGQLVQTIYLSKNKRLRNLLVTKLGYIFRSVFYRKNILKTDKMRISIFIHTYLI